MNYDKLYYVCVSINKSKQTFCSKRYLGQSKAETTKKEPKYQAIKSIHTHKNYAENYKNM